MRSKGRSAAWLILLSMAGSCLLLAQSHPSVQGTSRKTSSIPAKPPAAKLLDSNQGLAILGAALETKHPGRPGADCSHLVHAIYEKAGFPYTYVPSSDLYVGTDEFHRVAQPQAGDLVVWLGHAGIVVNPGQRTFYSALRSGLGVQAYDSAYWKRRGRPHFFRYVRETAPPLLTASNRGATLKPAGLRNGGSHESILTTTGTSVPEDSEDIDSDGPSEALPATIPSIPNVVNVQSVRPKPDQVRTALLQEFQDAGEALLARDVLKLYPSLVAIDHFEVKKVQLKGDQGWAEVHMSEPSLITSASGRAKKYPKVQRWNLHRQSADVWELTLPADAIYVPREVAVHLMAHQLAALTDADSSNSNSDDKARLARWLDVLLAESPAR
jgi:hypothetical protein